MPNIKDEKMEQVALTFGNTLQELTLRQVYEVSSLLVNQDNFDTRNARLLAHGILDLLGETHIKLEKLIDKKGLI